MYLERRFLKMFFLIDQQLAGTTGSSRKCKTSYKQQLTKNQSNGFWRPRYSVVVVCGVDDNDDGQLFSWTTTTFVATV